jgi:hypothetical protein
MLKFTTIFLMIISFIFNASLSFSQYTAKEIVEKSVKAHGGIKKLTEWKTLSTKGEIILDQSPSIKMRGSVERYFIKPGKMRLDQDFTAFEPNNVFRTYILNNGQGWAITNLIPNYAPHWTQNLKLTLEKADGMAYFLLKSRQLNLLLETTINGKPVYFIESVMEKDTTYLFIDKKSFLLLADSLRNTKMVYSVYKKFSGVMHPVSYEQIVYSQDRITVNKFKTMKVIYNSLIDTSLFEEEKPKYQQSKNESGSRTNLKTGILKPSLYFNSSDTDSDYIFKSPRDITIDKAGSLYIFDYNDNKIRKYDINGKYEITFGGKGNMPGAFSHLTGIKAVNNNLLCVDGPGLLTYNSNGTFLEKQSFPEEIISEDPPFVMDNGNFIGQRIIQNEVRTSLAYYSSKGEKIMELDSFSLKEFFPEIKKGDDFFLSNEYTRFYRFCTNSKNEIFWISSDKFKIKRLKNEKIETFLEDNYSPLPFPDDIKVK